jgi:hypothetical protein
MHTLTVAIISHDRLKKLEHMIYEMSEQTLQADKLMVYCSGYDDATLSMLKEKYPTIIFDKQPDKKDWGHDKRALSFIDCDTDYICNVNDDDQYPFVYLEWMMREFDNNPEAQVVYCDFGLRTREEFFITAAPVCGYITNGNMMFKKEVVKQIPYKHRLYAGDWWFVKDCLDAGIKFHHLEKTLAFLY